MNSLKRQLRLLEEQLEERKRELQLPVVDRLIAADYAKDPAIAKLTARLDVLRSAIEEQQALPPPANRSRFKIARAKSPTG